MTQGDEYVGEFSASAFGDLVDQRTPMPEALLRATSLIGTEAEGSERLAGFKASGVIALLGQPMEKSSAGRIERVEAVRSLIPR